MIQMKNLYAACFRIKEPHCGFTIGRPVVGQLAVGRPAVGWLTVGWQQ